MKLAIIIPAFNEDKVIFSVLNSIPSKIKGVSKIEKIVVDDGSGDNTREESLRAGASVIRHHINRGAGAATKTGIIWAKKKKPDIIVTFDADGQHNPKNIERIIKPILDSKADLVIGSRFMSKQKVPIDRYLLNWSANFITFLLFGVFSSDTQSGLRALSKKAYSLIDFKNDRMEFSSEILIEAKKHNIRKTEVPVDAIYTKYSRNKGQKNTNSIAIFSRFLIKLFR